MKYFILLLPIVAMFYLLPLNAALGFMIGSFFAIVWKGYYD